MSSPSALRLDSEFANRPALVRILKKPASAWFILGVLLFLDWGPRLLRSFWVDEAGTYWMVHDGLLAAIQRTWHWPGQSILYSVIESLFCLQTGPLREIVLRIPSLIGMAAAAYFLYRFAEQAIGRGAGFLTVTLFLLNPVSITLGTEARPYALALAAVAASSWTLYRWVELRSKGYLIAYIAASTLIVYLHYLFITVFCAQLIYLLFVFFIERRYSRWKAILAAYVSIALLATPLIPHIRLLLREAHTLPFMMEPPYLGELNSFLLHQVLALGLFLAGFVTVLFFTDCVKQPISLTRPLLVFFLTWLLLIPVLFFAVSVLTTMRVFVDRYISFAVEADALLLATAGYAFFSAWPGRFWVLLAVVLSTASPQTIRHNMNIGIDDLKPFMNIIKAESKSDSPAPVFFRSELPESNSGDWRSGLNGDGHLYAPFVAYPMRNRLIPLPFHFTDEVRTYISQTIDSQLRNLPEVIFVTHDPNWDPWMINRMKQAGFEAASIQKPNSFTVIIFKKPPYTQ